MIHQPNSMKSDDTLIDRLRGLCNQLSGHRHGMLIQKSLETLIAMSQQDLDRLDWKILSSALVDMQAGFEVFHDQYPNNSGLSFYDAFLNNQQIIKYNDLVFKNINHLFFGTFFYENIYIYKSVIYSEDWLNFTDSEQLNYSVLGYVFVVPLTLYSQVINFSFRYY